jgi:hypothetical protein
MLAEDERRNADLQKINEKFNGLGIAELGAKPASDADVADLQEAMRHPLLPTPAGEA